MKRTVSMVMMLIALVTTISWSIPSGMGASKYAFADVQCDLVFDYVTYKEMKHQIKFTIDMDEGVHIFSTEKNEKGEWVDNTYEYSFDGEVRNKYGTVVQKIPTYKNILKPDEFLKATGQPLQFWVYNRKEGYLVLVTKCKVTNLVTKEEYQRAASTKADSFWEEEERNNKDVSDIIK